MSFEKNIKEWVKYDNEIKELNKKIKDLRNIKMDITTNIMNYVNENNINDSTIKISDGNLRFANVKVQSPLTYKYIEECLLEIINDDTKVKQIITYIKNKRESKYVEEIKRFYS